MTLDLVLFLIVAGVAVISAMMMLISRNAVHAALFLVTNFLCVALFYLMLNAPFLGMIQVTVYAGAIMVLFMFVIMLLGADKLGGEAQRYRWLAPMAVVLTTALLLVSAFVLVQGNVGILKPQPRSPEFRVVHAIPGAAAVDFYVGDVKLTDSVGYRESSDFAKIAAGEYIAKIFPACEAVEAAQCPDPIVGKIKPLLETRLKFDPEAVLTYVIAGNTEKLNLIAVPTDVKEVSDESQLRVQLVNALPDQTVNFVEVDTARYTLAQTDDDREKAQTVLVDALKPGASSAALTLVRGQHDLAWRVGKDRVASVASFTGKAKTAELLVLVQEPSQRAVVRPEAARVREAFGSPQEVGHTMLGYFLLPFELVSLLLLAAMVGAIILTREEVAKRVRQRLVVSDQAARINRAVAARQAAQSSSQPEASAD